VILAGDTFEDSNVPRETIRRVVDVLRRSAAPVVVLPGNHDPLVAKGVFEHLAWSDARPRVIVARDRTPVAIGAADLLPCPLLRANGVEDPLADLPAADGSGSRIRIGVAHGSLVGAAAPGDEIADDFPMDRGHARRAGLDYLALGHWHAHSAHEVDGVPRVAYSGTHEPTKFGETGGCLIVSIAAPGAPPRIEHVPCAEMEWRRRTVVLQAAGDLESVRRDVDAEPEASAARVLLELRLAGTIPVADHERLADLEGLLAARFLHARLRRDGLRLVPADDRWIESLPAGAPRAAARALGEQAAREGREGEVAARALLMLFDLAGGAST
jgi:DNA repair exonuclease SbcCD nuclease subunit